MQQYEGIQFQTGRSLRQIAPSHPRRPLIPVDNFNSPDTLTMPTKQLDKVSMFLATMLLPVAVNDPAPISILTHWSRK